MVRWGETESGKHEWENRGNGDGEKRRLGETKESDMEKRRIDEKVNRDKKY